MSMPQVDYWSAAAVRALPYEGKRYETIHGELVVTPAPRGRHQLLVTELMWMLTGYLKRHRLSGLVTSPADIIFGDDTLVQPDLLIGDLDAFARSGDWVDVKTLYLVIEILSASSMQADCFTKRRVYQEQGVPTYWIVDPDNNQVEVWTPETLFPTAERETLTWRHPAIAEECVIDVRELFAR